MRGLHTFTITKISNQDIKYTLENVEFLGNGLKKFCDACNNSITEDNQRFSICATIYGSSVPEDGQYSAEMQILLGQNGKLYLYEATISNADFCFSVSREETASTLQANIIIYPIPSNDSACQMNKVE